MRVFGNDLVSLNHNNENINDQIINLLNQVCLFIEMKNKKSFLLFSV